MYSGRGMAVSLRSSGVRFYHLFSNFFSTIRWNIMKRLIVAVSEEFSLNAHKEPIHSKIVQSEHKLPTIITTATESRIENPSHFGKAYFQLIDRLNMRKKFRNRTTNEYT